MGLNFKKTICLVLAALTVLGATGCDSWKLKSLYIPEYEDAGQRFRTMADIPPNPTNREQLQLYKDAGFNAMPYDEGFVKAEDVVRYGEDSTYIQGLKVCEEYGIDAFIRPHKDYVSYVPTTEPCYYEKYFSDIDFRDYPAVKGFCVVDEPSLGQVQDVGDRYLTWFNENYGGEGYRGGSKFHKR